MKKEDEGKAKRKKPDAAHIQRYSHQFRSFLLHVQLGAKYWYYLGFLARVPLSIIVYGGR